MKTPSPRTHQYWSAIFLLFSYIGISSLSVIMATLYRGVSAKDHFDFTLMISGAAFAIIFVNVMALRSALIASKGQNENERKN